MMKSCIAFLFAGTALLSGPALSRPEAAKKISGSPEMAKTIMVQFAAGQFCIYGDPEHDVVYTSPYGIPQVLVNLGYAAIQDYPQGLEWCKGMMNQRLYISKVIQFTTEGNRKAARDRWDCEYKYGHTVCTLPVAYRTVTEVTGIRETAAGLAVVDFSWKPVPNDIGQEALRRGDKSLGSMYIGTASFELYDDGWRLKGVQFPGSR